MFKWLRSLLGIGEKKKRVPEGFPRSVMDRPQEPAEKASVQEKAEDEMELEEEVEEGLPPETREFLLELATPHKPSELHELLPDDRLFLSGVIKMIHEKRVAVHVLPRTSIEIQRLQSNPMSSTSDFVGVLELDPALNMKVLKVANSAYYCVAQRTSSLHEAVVRIGLTQLRTIVILDSLQGKILQAGVFRKEADWISEFSIALAHLAQSLAIDLGLDRDAAFTIGLFMFLEHFVVMGMVSDVSKEHRKKIQPSARSLWETLSRFGPQIRGLMAREWGMEDLLIEKLSENNLADRYQQLQQNLVAQWTGEDLPREVDGVSPEKLESVLIQVDRPGTE